MYELDYMNTLSPIVKYDNDVSPCIIDSNIPLVTSSVDIKNVFLNDIFNEEIYIEQPPSFVAQGEFANVCRLKKSLYILKQSLRV